GTGHADWVGDVAMPVANCPRIQCRGDEREGRRRRGDPYEGSPSSGEQVTVGEDHRNQDEERREPGRPPQAACQAERHHQCPWYVPRIEPAVSVVGPEEQQRECDGGSAE